MHKKKDADWHHAHFGIKFTEYESGEKFFGYDRLVLKWFKGDPAYSREIFCYDLFRRCEERYWRGYGSGGQAACLRWLQCR